jgi:hypothetical protein
LVDILGIQSAAIIINNHSGAKKMASEGTEAAGMQKNFCNYLNKREKNPYIFTFQTIRIPSHILL